MRCPSLPELRCASFPVTTHPHPAPARPYIHRAFPTSVSSWWPSPLLPGFASVESGTALGLPRVSPRELHSLGSSEGTHPCFPALLKDFGRILDFSGLFYGLEAGQ